jgi:hypothetical protein
MEYVRPVTVKHHRLGGLYKEYFFLIVPGPKKSKNKAQQVWCLVRATSWFIDGSLLVRAPSWGSILIT